jgi:hypothetical protein
MPMTLPRAAAFRVGAAAFVLPGVLLTSACQREPTDRTSQESKQAMVAAISTRFRVAPEEVGPIRQIIWNDDCYGIILDRECTPGTYYGYRLEALVNGQAYTYHALVENPSAVMLAQGPDPRIGLPALSWQWVGESGICESLLIAPDGLPAVGLCGGPHAAHALYAEMGRPEEWQYFHGRFATFEITGDDFALSFQSNGMENTSPAWQRAVAAWAELQWAEIVAGPADGYGLALSARRPVATQPDSCDFLQISEYGRAALSRGSCAEGTGDAPRYAWVDDDIWNEIGSWHASWSPIYDVENGLQLYARGTVAVGGEEQGRLRALVDQLIARMGGAESPPAPPPS